MPTMWEKPNIDSGGKASFAHSARAISSTRWRTSFGLWRNLPDFFAIYFGKPEVAIRACGDAIRKRGDRRNRILGNQTACGNLPNLVAAGFREPEIAVGPSSNGFRTCIGRGNGIFGDRTARGDLSDLIAASDFGEPEVAVRACGNPM